uniref:Uncharacterized protein n=1 Tax=Avena sativa TaxID=4498 RepID=A0ACD5WV90_AVESA
MAEAAGGGRPLPEDLIIWEILTRLPAKPVRRCRAVCRSWRRCLTSDAKFLLAHHRRQPSFPLVTTSDEKERRIDALDHRTGERRPVARTDRTTATEDLDVLASCDGLLILISYGGLYICNPTTRQLAPLPLFNVNCISGLYPHPPSGSYRVLCCVNTDGHAVYHVHTVGSGDLRCIGEPLEPWASGDVVEMMPMMEFLQPHVLAGGRLYWHPLKLPVGGSGKVNNMLVFDTVAESFRHVLSPVEGPCIELFEINGTLGLYNYRGSSSTADLWVLQNNERWVWSFKHRIKLQAMAFSVVPDTNGDMIVLSKKGQKPGLRWQYLQHISGTDGSSLRRYEWNVFLKLKKLRFKESLVRHSFFSMEGNNDGGVDEKPLFEGLSTVAVPLDDNYDPHACSEESMLAKSFAGVSLSF